MPRNANMIVASIRLLESWRALPAKPLAADMAVNKMESFDGKKGFDFHEFAWVAGLAYVAIKKDMPPALDKKSFRRFAMSLADIGLRAHDDEFAPADIEENRRALWAEAVEMFSPSQPRPCSQPTQPASCPL
jgi:hypothetical protein